MFILKLEDIELNNAIQSGVHICSVARAVIPNLAPVLDRRFKSKRVILIYTADFLPTAKTLANTFKQYQIKTEYYEISSAFNIETLRTELGRLFMSFNKERPLINISAGTKPMSIVLFEQAKALDFPVYYMNMDDSISWLSPTISEKWPLEDRVKLKPFLMAHGLELISHSNPSSDLATRHVLDELVCNIDYYKKAISQLNFYAYTANNPRLESKKLTGNLVALKELIELFEKADLLKFEGNKLYFHDENARFFANGGWLEVFLFHQIKQVSSKVPQLQDNLCGVEVKNTCNSVKNEIDNLVLSNNNLFAIECKTKRFNRDGKPDGGAVQSIYKLETVMTALGGPFSKGMVVSVFDFSQADIKRANQHNIKVIGLDQLKNIKTHLMDWFNTPNKW
jgi:hypothetical protein